MKILYRPVKDTVAFIVVDTFEYVPVYTFSSVYNLRKVLEIDNRSPVAHEQTIQVKNRRMKYQHDFENTNGNKKY